MKYSTTIKVPVDQAKEIEELLALDYYYVDRRGRKPDNLLSFSGKVTPIGEDPIPTFSVEVNINNSESGPYIDTLLWKKGSDESWYEIMCAEPSYTLEGYTEFEYFGDTFTIIVEVDKEKGV